MSQISISGKALKLFEFENIFNLDLNLVVEFKSAAKKLQNQFLSSQVAHIYFGPVSP
jgi:hypothetical protein